MLSRFSLFLIFVFMTVNIPAQIAPPIEAGVSQTLAKWRAANYSDVRYKLNITLEKGAPLMKGEIEVRVKLTDAGAKNDLILDWRTTQFANDNDKSFANVVAVNEQKIQSVVRGLDAYNYFISNEHLGISRTLLRTGENVIKINFASPIKTSGAAITRYVDKEDAAEYVYSLFVPSDASTAFPVFDQPDLKARFQFGLQLPPDWKAVSNGIQFMMEVLSKCEQNKLGYCPKSISFEETQPISTYVFAFAAGNFEQFNERNDAKSVSQIIKEHQSGKNIDWLAVGRDNRAATGSYIYVRKSQAEKFKQHAAEVFRLNRACIKFLESYFDYKFPFPKYDLVLIPEFPFGGMEHAGATFLREDRVIFPTEPTKNDYITRANVIFHEAAHQWFGDTVTMRWFDDLWLKEGFAEFMAYKTLEKVMPEYNAWKIFYERNKQLAYLTDSTRGTTPIYQEIPNLSAAKSAYGNIVYRKAPSFLRQAEFYLGEDKFQTAVRAFLKKHEFANAEWTDLVKEFETADSKDSNISDLTSITSMRGFETSRKPNLKDWANVWVKQRGLPIIRFKRSSYLEDAPNSFAYSQQNVLNENVSWLEKFNVLFDYQDGSRVKSQRELQTNSTTKYNDNYVYFLNKRGEKGRKINFIFPNYQDYGYGIFLLDEQSRAYILENIQTEKDDFLRAMMWGSLWDSVREAELAPADYVALVIKNINVETDESTIQTLLARVSTAMNYYLSEPSASAGGLSVTQQTSKSKANPPADAGGSDLAAQLERLLIERMQNAPTLGQRITFYRAFLNVASTEKARAILKDVLNGKLQIKDLKLKTKDKFDIATKLLILSDKDAANLLAELEKTETSDEAKRYAYAARAGIATVENKQKFFSDFVSNKEISESYIETAFVPFNSTKHADLTLPFLENALKELPNLKRSRKIFFINGWLSAFIGGQKSEQALQIVNKFLADNPNLDKDLRLKVLEVSDGLERAVKIREKYGK